MNDDALKQLWQQQTLRKPAAEPELLVAAARNQTSRLRRTLDARDLRELAACTSVVIVFVVFYFTEFRSPVSRLGDLIVIGSSCFIACKLVYTRRKTPPAPPEATVVESLRAELKAVRAQSQLLGSVLWWYLLPLGLGVLVCFWGSAGSSFAANLGYTVFVIAINAWIYWLNQRARTQQLVPVEAQLTALIRSTETGEPPEESEVATLRPIVLSLRMAEGVRPVEFKVAFWQLAIYGVPGILGIWFFLVLLLSLGNRDGMVSEPPALAPVTNRQADASGGTNREFRVAQVLVDRFNAGNYAALQALYNPAMSAFSPPQATAAFYQDLAGRYGKIVKIDGPSGHGYHGWPAFRLECQRGEMTLSLALDAHDQVAGIYFEPRTLSLTSNPRTFIRRLFSWPHVYWGMAAFAAGLIYTWLIQRTTRRAVGISRLGIHLHHGTTLILWEEIKDVRPFRFLNVRNLWLIQESGQETRMHWTPLERHADVVAAIEAAAPAHHPIRRYLSLL